MTQRRKLSLFILVLAAAGLACQTVVGAFNQAPVVTASPNAAVPDSPTVQELLTLEEQLAIFDELWNIINDEYLYEDFNGVDWDAAYDEYRHRVEVGLTADLFYYTMDEMIYSLGDDHSIFLSPEMVAAEDAEYEGERDYVGIGVWLTPVFEEETATVVMVFPGSPAEEAGLQAHDTILSIYGGSVLDEYGYISERLLGEEGTEVTITVQSPGEAPRQLALERARIRGTIPVPYRTVSTSGGLRIGYIFIPTFSEGSVDDQLQEALETLTRDGPLDGIILDNRMNAGGYDDVMANSLRYFTKGTVGHFVNREGREPLSLRPRDIHGSLEIPLVVLVGLETVSFGEVFAGVLQDQQRAYLIGETTTGNIESLWGYDFSDGSRAWIAHDTFRPANHPEADWEETGIVPDLVVPTLWHQITFETDPAIQAALDYFENR